MEKIVVGIDPGKSGAGAVIKVKEDGSIEFLGVVDIPFNKEKDLVDLEEFFAHIENIANSYNGNILYVIERVHARPTDGVASAFGFGKLFGSLLGYLEATGAKYELIAPRSWRKMIEDAHPEARSKNKKERKETSLVVARKYAGDFADLFSLKKHHNRAEALLIAVAGAVKWRGAKFLA